MAALRVALAVLAWLSVCTAPLALAATAGDAERGRQLYDGRMPLPLADGSGMAPTACVACHRPSGLGNFEGGLAVPPIAGRLLFESLDRDTARFFRATARQRIRPAYDEARLARLLRTGTAPDGVTMHAAMPRLQIADAQVADLAAHLRGLSTAPPPGVQDDGVYLATVSTPDADPQRRDAMLATLAAFVAQKNGQSRHESSRSAQASQTHEMKMYTKFRVWHLAHWALHGEPQSWPGQLAAFQAARPVFALVAGIGRADWTAVDVFCARERLPCLLPLVEAGADGGAGGSYALHYQRGIDAEALLAAKLLREQHIGVVRLWRDDAGGAWAARMVAALERGGIRVVSDTDPHAQAVVSLLAPPAQLARRRAQAPPAMPLLWLPGLHGVGQAELDEATQGLGQGWVVTSMRGGAALDRQLLRARTWMRQQGLSQLPADVVGSSLQAAMVLGDGLAHLDFGFTPEYLLELLEHGLENMVPWSPFPRLSIGPDQRVAVKQIQVAQVRDGRLGWTEMAPP